MHNKTDIMHIRNLKSLVEKHITGDQLMMYKYVVQELDTCRKDLGFSGNVDTIFTPRNIKEIYAYMISSVDNNLVSIYKEVIEKLAQWLKKDVNLSGITAAEDLITFEENELPEIEEADEGNNDADDEDEDEDEDDADEDDDDEDDDEDEDDEDEDDDDDDDSSVDPFMFLKIVSTVKQTLDTHNELIKEQNQILAKYVTYFKYALLANCVIGSAAIGVMGSLIYRKL